MLSGKLEPHTKKANVFALISDARAGNNTLVGRATGVDGMDGFFMTQKKSNDSLIEQYTSKLNDLLGKSKETVQEQALTAQLAEAALIPRAVPQPVEPNPATANATTEKAEQKRPLADYFTPITIEISSTSSIDTEKTSATSYSFGAQASYGFLQASVNASHSDAQKEAMKEMVNSNVKISFEVMRVDITRPWLRGELFYDEDLVPGPKIK